jgi:hypothetical protein
MAARRLFNYLADIGERFLPELPSASTAQAPRGIAKVLAIALPVIFAVLITYREAGDIIFYLVFGVLPPH